MRTWIIGSGGLFGSALARASTDPFFGARVPWSDIDAATRVLEHSLRDFSASTTGDWCVAWAAGRATTVSTQSEADQEFMLFERFIQLLTKQPPSGRGVFLFTSSAGGVYSGSKNPPFSSASNPEPLGTYGRLKLAQEIAAQARGASFPVVTIRLSNLYGPGQDLGKLQGVISRLALAAINREPITMFVPLDTMRDYVFTDDAAARALHWADVSLRTRQSATRVVASGQTVTLGRVIALMHGITRVRIPTASGVHASAHAQARDLRLQPDEDETLLHFPTTPLPVGMKRVFLDLQQRHAMATLAGPRASSQI